MNRSLGLDCLRSVSISIVLFNHCLIGFFFSNGRLAFEGPIAAISASTVLSIEWLFVLSGFLIGAMMIRSFETQSTWFRCARDFWLRRWFRTIPNYYLFVGVNAALASLGLMHGQFDFKFLVFSQNLAWTEPQPHFFGESWSLALDEWFYFLMPLLLGLAGALLFKKNHHRFLFVSCLLIVFPMIARLLAPTPADFLAWDAQIRRITVFHLDATGWGVLAAVFSRWHREWWRDAPARKLAAGCAAMLAGLAMNLPMLWPASVAPSVLHAASVLSITLMSGGTFLMMAWLTRPMNGHRWVVAAVGTISLYSYTIYLAHLPLLALVKAAFAIDVQSSGALVSAAIVLWLAAVLAVSSVVFNFFEKPTADLRDRFTRQVDASPFS